MGERAEGSTGGAGSVGQVRKWRPLTEDVWRHWPRQVVLRPMRMLLWTSADAAAASAEMRILLDKLGG
jgi:hypothetical protein